MRKMERFAFLNSSVSLRSHFVSNWSVNSKNSSVSTGEEKNDSNWRSKLMLGTYSEPSTMISILSNFHGIMFLPYNFTLILKMRKQIYIG